MGVTERRQREKEALRGHILSAAAELFADEGFENVSMRKIAEKIEYAPSTIYLYFKDKEELLNTIAFEVFEELASRLQELQSPDIPPLEALHRSLRYYIEFGVEHPHHYRLTFGPEPIPSVPGELRPCEEAGIRCFDQFRQLLVRGMDAGVIRRGEDADVLAQSVWMAIHGVTDLLITSKTVCNFPWAPQEDVIQCSTDLILRSLRPDEQ